MVFFFGLGLFFNPFDSVIVRGDDGDCLLHLVIVCEERCFEVVGTNVVVGDTAYPN